MTLPVNEIKHFARSLGIRSGGDGVHAACSLTVWDPNAWTVFWPDVNCLECLVHAPEEEKERRRAEWERLET